RVFHDRIGRSGVRIHHQAVVAVHRVVRQGHAVGVHAGVEHPGDAVADGEGDGVAIGRVGRIGDDDDVNSGVFLGDVVEREDGGRGAGQVGAGVLPLVTERRAARGLDGGTVGV